jgi:hypothetical protein
MLANPASLVPCRSADARRRSTFCRGTVSALEFSGEPAPPTHRVDALPHPPSTAGGRWSKQRTKWPANTLRDSILQGSALPRSVATPWYRAGMCVATQIAAQIPRRGAEQDFGASLHLRGCEDSGSTTAPDHSLPL